MKRDVASVSELLEDRALLASVSDGGGTTLTISLDANEDLAVVSNGATYTFSSDMNFTNGGVANTGDFSAFGATSLTLEASGLASYSTVSIVDAGTSTTVTFNTSGVNTYTDHFSVALDDSAAGAITFNGATAFTTSNSLSATTKKNIVVGSGAAVSTVDGGLTLSANQQVTPTSGHFFGVDVNNALIQATGTGVVTVLGKGGGGGSGGEIGVFVQGGGDISGGTSGLLTVLGTGGIASAGAPDNCGVLVRDAGSTITSSGGNVSVTGTGGGDPSGSVGNYGVLVFNAGQITAGSSGTVTVLGTGGATTSTGNRGVSVSGANAMITSGGGNVSVTGNGGGTGGSANNYGILVDSAGQITAGGSGTVTVVGQGGNLTGTGTDNIGVYVISATSKITSNGGNVAVTGTGGGAGTSSINRGVQVQDDAEISATGSGTVTVTGVGGTGSGGDNTGVRLRFTTGTIGGRIASAGGAIQITGTAGQDGTIDTLGFLSDPRGSVSGGPITLVADSVAFDTSANPTTISAGAGTVTLRQQTNGVAINLGSTIDTTASTLELSDAELDRVTAGTVNIGDANSGTITVSAAITHSNNLSLMTGAGITANDAITMAVNKNLTASAVSTINLAMSNSDFALTGSGAISLTTQRDIVLASGSSVTTVNGNLTLAANSAGANAGNFVGLDVNGGTITTSGTGNVSLTAKGGNDGATGSHYGIQLRNAAAVTSTQTTAGAGTITINGTAGTGTGTGNSDNTGVVFSGANTKVTSAVGDILISNQENTSGGYNNVGVRMTGGALVQSTQGAKITVTATGGTGLDGVYGVSIDGSTTKITSTTGDISITGISGSGSGQGNAGVLLSGSAVVESTSGAKITVAGTGRNTYQSNSGVRVTGNAQISSNSGDISITGDYSASSGIYSGNVGIRFDGGGAVVATNAAKITMNGTGGTGGGSHVGVLFSGGSLSSQNGDISLIGTAIDTTGADNHGISIDGGSAITTTGTANVTLTGTAGSTDPTVGYGIILGQSGTATFTLTGSQNTFIADSMSLTSNATINAGANTVTLRQKTNTKAIDLGAADSTTVLGLTDAELDRITAGTLAIGNAFSGAITFSGDITRSANTNVNLTTASDNNIAFGAFSLNAGTGGDVTLTTSGSGAISTDSTGTDITADDVTLNAGSGGIGSTTNFVRLAASTVSATTSDNSGINLAEADSVAIGSGGLNAGTGTITFGGGTFVSNDPLTYASSVTVNAGATLTVNGVSNGGSGTVNGLLALYTFDNSVTADVAGGLKFGTSNGQTYNGLAVGNPVLSSDVPAGASGNSLLLDGTSAINALYSGNGGNAVNPFSGANDYTITSWFKTATTSTSSIILSSAQSTSGASHAMAFYVDRANAPDGRLTHDNYNINARTSGSLNNLWDNQWHFGAVSYTASTNAFTFTVDGTTVNSGSYYPANTTYLGDTVQIGNSLNTDFPSGGVGLNGRLDDVGIFSKALSPAELANIRNRDFSAFMVSTANLTLTAGTLTVNGTLNADLSKFDGSATLQGTGTVNGRSLALTGSTIAPGVGSGTGVLNTGNVSLDTGATLDVSVNGTTVGTQYDQLNVTGTVSLSGTLNLSTSLAAAPTTSLVIINNDGNDPVSGTFQGLPEGAIVSANGVLWQVSYVGGAGNDVVLSSPHFITGGSSPGGVELANGASTLAIWLDGSDPNATGIAPSNGTTISTWQDKSGYDRDAVTQSGYQSPTFVTSVDAYNNMSAVGFNTAGGADRLRTDADFNSILGANYSIFAVSRYSGSVRGRVISTEDTNWLFGHWNSSAENWYFNGGRLGGPNDLNGRIYTGLVGPAAGTGSNPVVDFWSNGTQLDSDSTSLNSGAYKPGRLTLGGAGGENSDAQIAELLVFNRIVNQTERRIIQNALSARYNLDIASEDRYSGDTLANGNYDLNVFGVGRSSATDSVVVAGQSGLGIAVPSSLDTGDFVLAGHNSATNSFTTAGIPDTVARRWSRSWSVDVTDANDNLGANLVFDYTDAGLSIGTAVAFNLLRSTDGGSTWVNVGATSSVTGDTVTFNLTSSQLATALYTLGDASGPIVHVSGAATYNIGDSAVAIAPSLTLIDPVSPTITSATISINGFVNGNADVLAFTPSAGITGSYDNTTGVLTLTGVGSSTASEFQSVLRSVTFAKNSFQNISSRTISFAVTDAASRTGSESASVLINASATSDMVTWDGNADGDGDGVSWSDPLNWDLDRLPDSNDIATFANLDPGTVTVDAPQAVGGIELTNTTGTPFVISGMNSVSLTLGSVVQSGTTNNSMAAPLAIFSTATAVTFNVAGSSVLTVDGAISGVGDLNKNGTGTLLVGGANTYTGATNINAGVFKLSGTVIPVPAAPAGAVGIYTFDSGTVSGNTVTNLGSSGTTDDGNLIYGATVSSGGIIGDALDTRGSGAAAMSLGSAPGISLASGSWTAAAMFNGIYADGDWNTLFRSSTADENPIVINAGTNDLGIWRNGFNDSGYDLLPSLTGWHHVAAVGSGSTTTFYVDGVQVGVANQNNVSDIFLVGSLGGQRFAELVDEVYIYQSSLNSVEVLQLYQHSTGIYFIASNNSIPDGSAVTVANTATLDLSGVSETVGATAGSGTIANGYAGSTATLTTGGNGSSTTFAGTIEDGAGTLALTKVGSGTMSLQGTTTYTGATTIDGGTLKLGSNDQLVTTNTVNIGPLGTLDLNNFNQTLAVLTGTGHVVDSTNDSTLPTLTLNVASGSVTSNNILGHTNQNGFHVVKTGAGSWTVGGTNTYAGQTTVAAGTLKLGSNSALGAETDAGKTVVQNGATLDIDGFRAGTNSNELVEAAGSGVGGNGAIVNSNFNVNQLDAFRRLTMTGDMTMRLNGEIGLSNNFGSSTINMGGYTLTKIGGRSLYLWNTAVVDAGDLFVNEGALVIRGTTTFNAPTRTITAASHLFFTESVGQTQAVNLVLHNVLFQVTGSAFTISGQVTLSGTPQVDAYANDLILSGKVTGAGGMNINGKLSLTNGNNDYTGVTKLNQGATLRVTANGTLGTIAGGTVVADSATLQFDGAFDYTTLEPIQIRGSGVNGVGAINKTNGDGHLAMPITLKSNASIGSGTVGSTLTIDPDIVLTRALTFTGAGNIVMAGKLVGVTATGNTLAGLNNLTTGTYRFTAAGQAFDARVDNDGTNSWLLIGRGREGWEFDTDGQGLVSSVITDLGTSAAFAPAAYSDALVNSLLSQMGIDNTDVEIRLKRAASNDGTAYQEARWRDFPTTDLPLRSVTLSALSRKKSEHRLWAVARPIPMRTRGTRVPAINDASSLGRGVAITTRKDLLTAVTTSFRARTTAVASFGNCPTTVIRFHIPRFTSAAWVLGREASSRAARER